MTASYIRGPKINPRARYILSWRFFLLPLIQEEQVVTYVQKYGQLPTRGLMYHLDMTSIIYRGQLQQMKQKQNESCALYIIYINRNNVRKQYDICFLIKCIKVKQILYFFKYMAYIMALSVMQHVVGRMR